MNNNIEQLVKDVLGSNLINNLEMQEWSEKDKIVYQKQIIDTVVNRVIARIIESLSMTEINEYKNISEKDEDAGWKFIESKVTDIKQIAAEEYIVLVAELKKELELVNAYAK